MNYALPTHQYKRRKKADPLSSSIVSQYQGLRESLMDLTPMYNVPSVKEIVTGDI